MFTPSASRRVPHRFDPVGMCIYCGTTSFIPLTTEHIIPQGLGGGLILPKSSCDPCRQVTQKLEETCLRFLLLPYRLHVGLVQHPHEINERIKQHPDFLLLPVLGRSPGILIGAPPGGPMPYHFMLATNHPNLSTMANHLDSFDLGCYFRMIAKIAHSFTVGQIGLGSFDPDLPPIIIGNHLELVAYLIGGSEIDLPVRSDALSHQVGLGIVPWEDGHLVRARIRLFAFHHSPAYDVIVGRLVISQEEFDARAVAPLS